MQYGFATTGVNVWVTDVEPFGSIEIATAGAPSIPGDFDGDGDVDGDDFLVWQQGFPTIYTGDDFLIWQQNYPFPGGGSGSTVPEPTAGAVAFLLALSTMLFRRR